MFWRKRCSQTVWPWRRAVGRESRTGLPQKVPIRTYVLVPLLIALPWLSKVPQFWQYIYGHLNYMWVSSVLSAAPPSLPVVSWLQWPQLFIAIMATFYWMPSCNVVQLNLTVSPMKVSFLYPFYRCGLERLSNLPKRPDFTKHRTWSDDPNLLHFGARHSSRSLYALQSRAGQSRWWFRKGEESHSGNFP